MSDFYSDAPLCLPGGVSALGWWRKLCVDFICYTGLQSFLAECVSCLPLMPSIGWRYAGRRFLILLVANNICWVLLLQFLHLDDHWVILIALAWPCRIFIRMCFFLPCWCVRFRLTEEAVCCFYLLCRFTEGLSSLQSVFLAFHFCGWGYVSRRSLILANNVCWGLMLQFVNFDAHSVILTVLTWLCGFYSHTLLCLPCCVRFRLEAAVCWFHLLYRFTEGLSFLAECISCLFHCCCL
jgi:hypothetical protein